MIHPNGSEHNLKSVIIDFFGKIVFNKQMSEYFNITVGTIQALDKLVGKNVFKVGIYSLRNIYINLVQNSQHAQHEKERISGNPGKALTSINLYIINTFGGFAINNFQVLTQMRI